MQEYIPRKKTGWWEWVGHTATLTLSHTYGGPTELPAGGKYATRWVFHGLSFELQPVWGYFFSERGTENAAEAVLNTPLMPNYQLSYSLQSHARESVSYGSLLGSIHSDTLFLIINKLIYI